MNFYTICNTVLVFAFTFGVCVYIDSHLNTALILSPSCLVPPPVSPSFTAGEGEDHSIIL